jgi:hypothetical protein
MPVKICTLTPKRPKLVENLIMRATPMSTVYHLDGPELRMTHHRGAQN